MSNDKCQLEVGLKTLEKLLSEFRKGNIFNRNVERKVLEQHTMKLSERWNQQFPGFPESRFPYSSKTGLLLRGKRDVYLKNIIIQLVSAHDKGNNTIVNPACFIAKHTRDLASRLPHFRVIGTDIDPRSNWICEHILRKSNPDNFRFIKDNIFEPQLDVTPTAVVFFGACGSVSDGAIDYAIETKSPYLIFRTCCHHMIACNKKIAYRPSHINRFFGTFYWILLKTLQKEKYAGFYFSDKYSKEHYTRSETARSVTNSNEFLQVCRSSADNDICRAIIDLDRYLLLVEKGYDVWYREELFVAERN
jgi:hypothetical protein